MNRRTSACWGAAGLLVFTGVPLHAKEINDRVPQDPAAATQLPGALDVKDALPADQVVYMNQGPVVEPDAPPEHGKIQDRLPSDPAGNMD